MVGVPAGRTPSARRLLQDSGNDRDRNGRLHAEGGLCEASRPAGGGTHTNRAELAAYRPSALHQDKVLPPVDDALVEETGARLPDHNGWGYVRVCFKLRGGERGTL